jgi:hypothetical protein
MEKLAGRFGASWRAVISNKELVPLLQGAASRCHHLSSVLCHDNSGAEFGAYQARLEDCLKGGTEFDWVLFCNDTYSIHQAFTALQIQYLEHWLRRPVSTPT